jgi:uncharacterized protein YdhG (YjbR/CyaY superfamily)
MNNNKVSNVDEYIATFPSKISKMLKDIRATIVTMCPDAEESISYGMPAYKYHGPLVYFAAFTNHIGFYALPSGHKAFEKELSKYKQGKGSVQFPINEPMPLGLIKEIVKFRMQENLEKMQSKKVNKKP